MFSRSSMWLRVAPKSSIKRLLGGFKSRQLQPVSRTQQVRSMMSVPNTGRSSPFKNLSSPSPDSLPKPKPKKIRPSASPGSGSKNKKQGGFRGRTALGLVVLGTAGYFYDKHFNAHAISRTIHTVYTLSTIALDYKLNFDEDKDIQALHLRTADKIYDLMVANKGLYIKIGQAVAVQASIFPPEFQRKFARLFDNAPQDSWEDIRNTLTEELGKDPSFFFEYIEPRAVASASVAQVHKARLRGTGEWVAVKVQHSYIRKQVDWDLFTYRNMMWVYEKMFDMPIAFISRYISSRMKLEIDFRREVENSEITRKNVEREWGAGDFPKVYIPKIYRGLSTERVLVAEWIEGVPLSDKEGIRRKFDVADIVGTVLTLFSKQVYEWGSVHCDPHPGNIIVRKKAGSMLTGDRQQVVLIDHGLYVHTSDKFRGQYSKLWKSLFLLDRDAIRDIMTSWGIGSEDLFASSIMLRPYADEDAIVTYNGGDTARELSRFELQQKMRDRMKSFIVDATRMPLELVFLGRTMSLLMGLNRLYGSPVNRIKILAHEASKAYSYYYATGVIGGDTSSSSNVGDLKAGVLLPSITTLLHWFQAWLDYTKFRLVVAVSNLAFNVFRLGQLFTFNKERRDRKGMEDYIEKQMVGMANKMGFQVEEGQLFNA